MMRKIGGFLILAALFGCDEAPPNGLTVTMPASASEKERTILDGATKMLLVRCPLIQEHANDFDEIRVSFLDPYVAENFGLSDSRGWRRMVEVELSVKRDTDFPADWLIDGHTVSIRMGGGHRPGFHFVKAQAGRLCGVEGIETMDEEQLAFIDLS